MSLSLSYYISLAMILTQTYLPQLLLYSLIAASLIPIVSSQTYLPQLLLYSLIAASLIPIVSSQSCKPLLNNFVIGWL